jgi:hypothetical protein
MAPSNDLIPVYVLGAICGVSLLLWLSYWYVGKRLGTWAADRGLMLVRWRTAWPWQGPRAWRRWRWQQDYYVAVMDRDRGRTGWLMVDWPLIGLGKPKVKAWWDGCMPEFEQE